MKIQNGNFNATLNAVAGSAEDTKFDNSKSGVEEQNLQDVIDMLLSNRSHVGMVVQSTSLDTEAKVIEMYGGSRWEKIEGRFLLGQSSSYDVKAIGGNKDAIVPYHNHSINAVATGTESVGHTHSVTGGSHSHSLLQYNSGVENGDFGLSASTAFQGRVKVGSSYYSDGTSSTSHTHTVGTESANHTHTVPQHNSNYVGESGNTTDANMPPYKVVFIWERVE